MFNTHQSHFQDYQEMSVDLRVSDQGRLLWIRETVIAWNRMDKPQKTVQLNTMCIGACRAVWVPGQDLATLHLTRNCGKRILSLHCMLYVHPCTHICYMLVTTCIRIRSSWYEYTWFEITWAMSGYARACRRLWQCVPGGLKYSDLLITCSSIFVFQVVNSKMENSL